MGNDTKTSKKYKVYNQAYIAGNHNSMPMEKLQEIFGQLKCACKIIDGNIIGTGFFCKIPYPDNDYLLPVLITCNHVFKPISKTKINFITDKKYYNLSLDNCRLIYSSKKFDITMIEIKNDDGLNMDNFLEVDENIYNTNITSYCKDLSVYILHHEYGEELKFSPGVISSTQNINLYYTCQTNPGSSGGPIINSNNLKVIGIHKAYHELRQKNAGKLIKEPIKIFYKLRKNGILLNKYNYNNSIPNEMQYGDEEDDDVEDREYEKNNEEGDSSEDKKYDKHQHSFSYYDYAIKKCSVCSQPITLGPCYECKCKIVLCLDCGSKILYDDNKNIFHDHTLKLIYTDMVLCDICFTLYINACTFHCKPCDFDVCISCFFKKKEKLNSMKRNDCLKNNDEQKKQFITKDNSQIKSEQLISMDLYDDSIHNHPLYFKQNLCTQCYYCGEYIMNTPGYECFFCDIILCLDCADKIYRTKI